VRKFVWTEAVERAVSNFWDEGLTARAIGDIIGTTRAAVLGKVRRMGLPMRIEPVTKAPALPQSTIPNPTNERRFTAEPLARLSRGDCKYPIGDPGDEDFAFCGEPNDGKHPYCAPHSALTYTTSKPVKFRDMKK